MTVSTVLRASSIVTFAFGALLLLVPAVAISGIYGMRNDGPTEFIARILGGQLLGFAVLDWRGSSADVPTQRRVNLAGGIAEGASLVGSLLAIGIAGGNVLVWTVPVVFAAFLIARVIASR